MIRVKRRLDRHLGSLVGGRLSCFWCEHLFEDIEQYPTVDHLFCKFIRKRFDDEGLNPWVMACFPCNHARGKISVHFEYIWRYENYETKKNFIKKDKLFKSLSNLFYEIDILKFKERIETQLEGRIRRLCLMEIEHVLSFYETEYHLRDVDSLYKHVGQS